MIVTGYFADRKVPRALFYVENESYQMCYDIFPFIRLTLR